VYDRLNAQGISLSYVSALNIEREMKVAVKKELITAIKQDSTLRLIGDNVNVRVGVKDERSKNHGKMLNYFGNVALINNFPFTKSMSLHPQSMNRNLSVQLFLLTPDDISELKKDYASILMNTAVEYFTFFQCLRDILPKYLEDSFSSQLTHKTKVIPISILPLDEQKGEHAVEILRYYEKLIVDLFTSAGISVENKNIHVGGDQLSRDRFTSAKLMVIGSPTPVDRLEHIGNFTFEFFHLQMNLLQVSYDVLMTEDDVRNIGRMLYEKNRLNRSSVKKDVKQAYDADADFFGSFTKAYIVEAIRDYFKLEDLVSAPACHCPEPDIFSSKDKLLAWANTAFEEITSRYVGTFATDGQVEYNTSELSYMIKCSATPKQ